MYVLLQCFYNYLAAELIDDASDFQRDLTGDPSGALKLRFALKLRVFTSEWTPSYTFVLNTVPLQIINVLSSNMRDQEEEIGLLRSELDSREEEIGALRCEVADLHRSVNSGENVAFVTAKTTKITVQSKIWFGGKANLTVGATLSSCCQLA